MRGSFVLGPDYLVKGGNELGHCGIWGDMLSVG